MSGVHLNHGVDDTAPCHCYNCDWSGNADKVASIHCIGDRLDPGSVVPVGECPDCGNLAYIVKPMSIGHDVARIDHAHCEYSVISIDDTGIKFMVDGSYLEQDVGYLHNPYTGERLTGPDVDPDMEPNT